MSEKETLLEIANRITSGDRMQQYGHPKQNFEHVARLWSAYLGNKIETNPSDLNAKDVALMMVLFKVSRAFLGDKEDNIVDIAGYARNLAQILGYE